MGKQNFDDFIEDFLPEDDKHMNPRPALPPALLAAVLILSAAVFAERVARADDIGVLYALEADWRSLKGEDAISTHSIGGTVIQTAKIGPHTVRGVLMGAGNVETAINASRLLAKFPCDWVVSLGPAGTLKDDRPDGVVYIVKDVVGYQRGTWSGHGWSLAAAARMAIPIPSAVSLLPQPWQHAGSITLASGDAFVANRGERDRIRAETGADFIDMNSFGAALACEKGKAPLLVLKFRSDAADESAPEDFKKFVAAYKGRHGGELREWIKTLPVSPDSPQAYEQIRKLLE